MTEGAGTISYGTWSMPARYRSSRSQRILVFGGVAETDAATQRLLKLLADTSHISMDSRFQNAARPSGRLLREWHRDEQHCSAVSLGVIAAAGSGSAAIREIMLSGCKGGPLPGAIALLGHDRSLVDALLAMAGQEVRSPIVMEWPPLLFILSADDPQIAECARACRAMRFAGIPATLEIVEADQDFQSDTLGQTGLTDFVVELDRFFSEHLIADFPKLFGWLPAEQRRR